MSTIITECHFSKHPGAFVWSCKVAVLYTLAAGPAFWCTEGIYIEKQPQTYEGWSLELLQLGRYF